jgi:hypothetical protein
MAIQTGERYEIMNLGMMPLVPKPYFLKAYTYRQH